MSRPLLSILIPTYNRRVELERAIDSILGQNLSGDFDNLIEIIIHNNASTDDTYDFLESLQGKSLFGHPVKKKIFADLMDQNADTNMFDSLLFF